MGVVILSVHEDQRALAENLTEVALSRLAELSDYELVGTRELVKRLSLVGGGDLPPGCLTETGCLSRVAMMAGARRLLTGNVRSEGTRFLLTMEINDVESGKIEGNFFRAVDGGLEPLIRAIQDGVEDLLRPRPAAAELRVDSHPDGATVVVDDQYRGVTPLWVQPVEPGSHRLRIEMDGRFPFKNQFQIAPGQNLLVSVNRDQLTPRRTWAPYLAYGTAAAAVLAFAAAGVFGTLARADPSGLSRGDAQKDLELRQTYATITNGLLLGVGALSVIAALTFFRLSRDVFGEN